MGMVISSIAAGFICLVFLRAALHKLGAREEFSGILDDYGLIPGVMIPVLSFLIPFIEIITSVLALIPSTRGIGVMMALVILILYAAAIGINLLRGRHTIDCGCGGVPQGISWMHVFRNMLLAGIASLPLWAPSRDLGGSAISGIGMASITVASVGLLWLLMLLFEQVLGNRSHVIAAFHSRY